MTDKHTPGPRYFLTELNDGIQWLTDGHDFGIDPTVVPKLLEVLERTEAMLEACLPHLPPQVFASATAQATTARAFISSRNRHQCPRCGEWGPIVNTCGCDLDNLPTRCATS